jgi:hypothetical protein
MAITRHRRRLSSPRSNQTEWQKNLEKEVLQHIPLVPRLRSSKELSARYPAYPYEINSKD